MCDGEYPSCFKPMCKSCVHIDNCMNADCLPPRKDIDAAQTN